MVIISPGAYATPYEPFLVVDIFLRSGRVVDAVRGVSIFEVAEYGAEKGSDIPVNLVFVNPVAVGGMIALLSAHVGKRLGNRAVNNLFRNVLRQEVLDASASLLVNGVLNMLDRLGKPVEAPVTMYVSFEVAPAPCDRLNPFDVMPHVVDIVDLSSDGSHIDGEIVGDSDELRQILDAAKRFGGVTVRTDLGPVSVTYMGRVVEELAKRYRRLSRCEVDELKWLIHSIGQKDGLFLVDGVTEDPDDALVMHAEDV